MNDKEKYLTDMQKNLDRYQRKFENASKSVANYSAQKKDQANSEIEHLKGRLDSAQQVYGDLKKATADNWDSLKDTASEAFRDLKDGFYEYADYLSLESLGHVKDEVMDYGQERMNDLSDCIKKKPFTSAAWALGIGFILGKMMTKAK